MYQIAAITPKASSKNRPELFMRQAVVLGGCWLEPSGELSINTIPYVFFASSAASGQRRGTARCDEFYPSDRRFSTPLTAAIGWRRGRGAGFEHQLHFLVARSARQL